MGALILYDPSSPTYGTDNLQTQVNKGVLYLVIIAVAVFICASVQMACWMWTGERQTKRIREEYLAAVLRQEIAWFDKTQTGEVTTRMTNDISAM
jgi:ABC-type multidrug transport system fused ATPase/permease subunit